MGNRYFPATALGGRLYLDGSAGADSLSTYSPAYCDEAVVDMLVARVGHKKTRTEAELDEVLGQSQRGLPALRIWICEGLEEVALKLWQEARTSPRRD